MVNSKEIKTRTHLIFRGIIFYTFYQLRYVHKIFFAKFLNKQPIINIKAENYNFKIKVDISDIGLSQDLIINQIREVPNVNYFIKYIKKHFADIDTIFDIGANIGYYALISSSLIKDRHNKKLIAIEPVKQNFSLLKQNFSLNHFIGKQFKLLNIAVGNRDCLSTMIVPDGRNLSHLSDVKSIDSIDHYSTERVQQFSLQTLLKKEKIKLSKVLFRWDVEGYEYNIITGNKDIFNKLKKSHIIMEFHPFLIGKRKSIEMLEALKNSGFELVLSTASYPLYFLKTPNFIRKLLIKSFKTQKGGEFGLIKRFKNIDSVINALENKKDPIYTSYPNLHLYFYKS